MKHYLVKLTLADPVMESEFIHVYGRSSARSAQTYVREIYSELISQGWEISAVYEEIDSKDWQ